MEFENFLNYLKNLNFLEFFKFYLNFFKNSPFLNTYALWCLAEFTALCHTLLRSKSTLCQATPHAKFSPQTQALLSKALR